jgi:hypothetical protein
MYTRKQYRADLFGGAVMAVAFSAVTALPLIAVGVVNIFRTARGVAPDPPWDTYLSIWLVVPGSYVVAGLVGANIVFLLRPLRRSLVGWALTGVGVSAAAYGVVGVALALFFDAVGRTFLDDTTRTEAWHMIPGIVTALSPIGALAGIYMGVKDRRQRARAA